jgi:hypothetical protein
MSENAQVAAERGHMNINDQQATFHHFLHFVEWGVLLIAMGVALLTVALAMGYGWFAGLAVFFVIGAVGGVGLKMGGAWWASLIGLTVALGVGGLIVAIAL